MKKHFTFILKAIITSDDEINADSVAFIIMESLPGIIENESNPDFQAFVESWEICCAEGQNNQG